MLKQPSPEYRGFRTAGIRLSEEMLPLLGKLYHGRTQPMLHAMHAFDKAHCVMLTERGLLARAAAAAILRSLREMEQDGVVETRAKVGGGLHSGEQYLIRRLGEDVGGRLHLARSSGDLSSVGINVLQREKLLAVLRAVNRLRRVLLTLSEMSRRMIGGRRIDSVLDAQMSVAWSVAGLLVRGRLTLAEVEEPALRDPAIREVMERVELVVDPDAHGERQTVEIETRDGRRLRERVETPRGHWDAPLSDAELREKFLELSVPALGTRAPAVADAVDRLDDATSLRHLVDLLVTG